MPSFASTSRIEPEYQFPRRWSWKHLRPVVLFTRGARGKARDFNWHNVIGIWSAVPLFIVVLSAVPISFPWASDLVYRAVGEEPPARVVVAAGAGRRRRAGGAGGARAARAAPREARRRRSRRPPGWRRPGSRADAAQRARRGCPSGETINLRDCRDSPRRAGGRGHRPRHRRPAAAALDG